MRVLFLFALFGLALSCDSGEWSNSGVCTACSYTHCAANQYYISTLCQDESNGCVGCNPSGCPAGQFYVTGFCHEADSGCRACSENNCGSNTFYGASCTGSTSGCIACSACPTGQYRSDGCSGTTDSICDECAICSEESPAGTKFRDGGCSGTADSSCTDCMTQAECIDESDPNYRTYGVCGGPHDTSSTFCVGPPGFAICQICPEQAENYTILCENGPPPLDGSFWLNATTPPEDCCDNLDGYAEDYLIALGEETLVVMAQRAYMWDQFIECTGITTVFSIP